MQICGDPLLLRLTLLLLLLLLAEALELLEHLLRRSRTLLRRRHNRGLLGRDLLGRRIVRRLALLILLWIAAGRGRRNGRVTARGEDDLAGCAVGGGGDHEEVVPGSVEQIGDDVAGRTRTADAEDARILVEAVDGHTAGGLEVFEDLRQAGIVGIDRQRAVMESDLDGTGRLIQQGRRQGWSGAGLSRRR